MKARPPKWWKYMILLASFFGQVIIWGFALCAGEFQIILLHEFNFKASVSELSVVSSMVPALTCFAGPISSFLTNRFGCRLVGIIGSIIATFALLASYCPTEIWHSILSFAVLGIGLGISYMPCVVSVYGFFDKGRPIAMGITTTGVGVGTLITPLLMNYAVERYFWRNAMVLLAGVTLNLAVCSSLFLSDGPGGSSDVEKTTKFRGHVTSGRFRNFTSLPFALLIVNNFLIFAGMIAFFVHLPSHLSTVGYSDFAGAVYLSIVGAGTVTGSLISGCLEHKFHGPVLNYAISMLLGGLATAFITFVEWPPLIAFLCFSFGTCTSSLAPMLPLITAQFIGSERMADGYGYLLMAEGIGALCGPPLAGYLYDKNGDYSLSMISGGLAILMGSLIIIPYHKHEAAKDKRYSVVAFEEPKQDVNSIGML